MSKKILFAIGIRDAEKFIKAELDDKHPGEYEVVGETVHKDNLIELIQSTSPNILVLREGLSGKEDIFKLAIKIKTMFGYVRIIFLSADRKVGDLKIANLVSYHIYDVLIGTHINTKDVIEYIETPRSFDDMKAYLPLDAELFKAEDFEKNKQIEKESTPTDTTTIVDIEKAPEKAPEKPPKAANNSILVKVLKGANKDNEKPVKDNSKELAGIQETLENLNREINNIKNTKPPKETTPAPAPTPVPVKKIEKPKPERVIKPPLGKIYSNPTRFSGKDKIITFWGAKNGIGTTTVAYNVAMDLALRKNKVLFIEFNEYNPMIAYWYYIYENLSLDNGVDKAILGLETNSRNDINNSIITREELIKQSGDLSDDFKKFPPTLDYLFFSAEYIEAKNKPILSNNSFSQLLLYLMQQLNYNYVIIDMNTQADISLIETALTFSNKNYVVISQEFSTIGYYQRFFKLLERKGLDFSKSIDGKKDASDKNSFIINRYAPKAGFNLRIIKDWIEDSKLFSVCDNSVDIADLSFNLKPIMTNTKNHEFIRNIGDIATDIEKV